jgi:hypothetical protein
MHARADALVAIRKRFEQTFVACTDGRPETLFERLARDIALNLVLARKRDKADRRTVRRNGGMNDELACHDPTRGFGTLVFIVSEIGSVAHPSHVAKRGQTARHGNSFG